MFGGLNHGTILIMINLLIFLIKCDNSVTDQIVLNSCFKKCPLLIKNGILRFSIIVQAHAG